MPMNRALYPADWDAIAREVKEAADWTCAECGRECYRPGESCDDRRRVLTVHHRDGNPPSCERPNLVALCPACHNRADVAMRVRHRRERRQREQEAAGQERMAI